VRRVRHPVAAFLPDVVLDAAAGEVAGDWTIEPVEEDPGRDPVADANGAMELEPRIGIEAAETSPADLDRGEAAEGEARRGDQRRVRRRRRVGRIGPQRIVVTNAFGEPEDRRPRRVLVGDANVGAQLAADQGPHSFEHLIGELGLRAKKARRSGYARVSRAVVAREGFVRAAVDRLIAWRSRGSRRPDYLRLGNRCHC
jgi:hypothetical protein